MANTVRPADQPLAASDDIQRLERQVAELTARVEQHDREIQIHVTRMGQLQADLDLIRAAWSKVRS